MAGLVAPWVTSCAPLADWLNSGCSRYLPLHSRTAPEIIHYHTNASINIFYVVFFVNQDKDIPISHLIYKLVNDTILNFFPKSYHLPVISLMWKLSTRSIANCSQKTVRIQHFKLIYCYPLLAAILYTSTLPCWSERTSTWCTQHETSDHYEGYNHVTNTLVAVTFISHKQCAPCPQRLKNPHPSTPKKMKEDTNHLKVLRIWFGHIRGFCEHHTKPKHR